MKTAISKERRFKRIVTNGERFDAVANNSNLPERKEAAPEKTRIAQHKLHLGHFMAGPHGLFNPLLLK